MKFIKSYNLLLLTACGVGSVSAQDPPQPEPNAPVQCGKTVGIEKIGSLPPGGSNWASPVPMKEKVFFLNQNGKEIYVADFQNEGELTKIFDENDKPEGVTWDFVDFNPEYILNVVPGDSNEVYVAFTSGALPEGVNLAGVMPDPVIEPVGYTGATANIYDCSELAFAVFNIPVVSQVTNQIIYKYKVVGKKLSSPEPIIAFETQGGPNHKGGAMIYLEDQKKILFWTGDGIPFGSDGRASAQDPESHLSSIQLIDPITKTAQTVAKGVRNPQHAEFIDGSTDLIAFMDIGGVTAEEVNVVSVGDLVAGGDILNFGWGRNPDGKAREGTFYIQPGNVATFGSPPVESDAPSPEAGFQQPYAQFGRNFDGFVGGLNAVTGPVTSSTSFHSLSMLFAELNSGTLFGTLETDYTTTDVEVCYIELVDLDGGEPLPFPGSLNTLNGGNRVDARFFRYPDGGAGVLLENTGEYYRLTELM